MVIRRPRPRRRRLVVVGVVLLVLVAAGSSRFYTDVLWFQEVGFASVLWKSIRTQFLVGLLAGIAIAALVYVNLVIAGRVAPVYRVFGAEGVGRPDPFDRYREMLTPYVNWVRIAVAAGIGLLAGLGASSAWRTVLLWANREPFGVTDPQFGKDAGFYMFELPFLEYMLGLIWFALMTSLVVSIAAHFFHGAIRPDGGLAGVIPGALAHLSVILGLLALAKAAQYWLGQYQLNFSPRGVVTGASYTDVNAQLPALKLLALISIISAVLFLVNIRVRRVALPLAAVGIWVLTSVLAGAVWPGLVQRFSVDPQELVRERPYIDRNIEATRTGFSLTDVQTTSFPASSELTPEDIDANESLLQNVRLWDPDVLQQVYGQLQAIRTYYRFEDVDIDRYEIDGEARQVLLSPRELSLEDLDENSKTWANLHLRFTHGYGVVASLANEATTAGQPEFIVKDVPGTVAPDATSMEIDQPGLYYGEGFGADEYSVVNSRQREVDFPSDDGPAETRYAGEGGILVGSILNRLAFAIREGDPNLLLSSLITGDSKILLYRNVRDRVLRAAPFLSLDSDPYIAIVDGRLVWIVDAYTSSRWYPYSQRFDAGEYITSDVKGTLSGEINYVRNSVKIVVDAYDGTMDFYIVEDDPLVEAWRNAFPELFTDAEPSDDLRAHFRYPEDLFKLQSEVYANYHMLDAGDFYAKEDAWAVSHEIIAHEPIGETPDPTITTTDTVKQDPTYLLIQPPGETEQEFLLTRPFTPRGRSNMISFFAARSDPESYGELVTLAFPRQKTVLGPVQVDNLINQDVEISRDLTLLRSGGSRVTFGSLVVLPIEDAILYVQPLFVHAATVGNPELKRVVLVFGERVVMEASFEEALISLFGAAEPEPEPRPSPDVTPGEDGGGPDAQLQDLIDLAARLYERAQAALADGDFETYGRLIERLGRVLRDAAASSAR